MNKSNLEFLDALQLIARDKGIAVDTLLEALANALVAAYKRLPGSAEEAVVTIDPDSGDIRVYGQELDQDGNVTREWDDTPENFGRIAAQTAKQVILQRIREAERDLKYEEYAGREGDIVTGIIQQSDNRYTLLDLGKVEALMPQAEQVPYERYEHNARVKAYIVEVRRTSKGPQIVVSRTHPGLIRRLFELEVPEISSGVVEIKAAAREPGHRTKIAVWSNDPNVDPVGACVGARGARVRMVTNELRGEKVDIVPYSDDPAEFVQRALQPAKVKEVRLDEETGTAVVIVHDFQLSLAIGKEGQNARLAARLTGWRIDIKSESQLAEEEAYASQDWAEGEWVENEAGEMVWQPAEGGEAVSAEQWSLGGGSQAPDAVGPDEVVEGAPPEGAEDLQTIPSDESPGLAPTPGAGPEAAAISVEGEEEGAAPPSGAAQEGEDDQSVQDALEEAIQEAVQPGADGSA
ncbi:MAG TPA: transcription termination factor NusA [Acidimicrobiales bacterium]|nr:transcription termination factor NusA [Acidimicrobiales bacterium]